MCVHVEYTIREIELEYLIALVAHHIKVSKYQGNPKGTELLDAPERTKAIIFSS